MSGTTRHRGGPGFTKAVSERKTMAAASENTQERNQFGTAQVSNVDGRGIFSVFGVFKRQEKASSKPVYDYASVLCHVAGEIRDGFLRERLKDNEVLPLLETHSKAARGKGVIVPCPVEEAAKFLVIPCYEKAKENRLVPAKEQVQKAIEFYERVLPHCELSEEEFLDSKLGNDEDQMFTSIDRRRPEFDAWWIEKRELECLDCPLPPERMNFPNKYPEYFAMPDVFTKMKDLEAQYTIWKKTFLEKLNTAANRERLAGMTRHQTLWYAWKKEGKLGATMRKSAKFFADCDPEKPLSEENVIMELMAKLTQSKFYSCGEDAKVDRQICNSGECRHCLTPAKTPSARNGSWLLTCIDKAGKAELGGEQTRKCLATILCAVQKYGVRDFRDAAEQCVRDSVSVFLQHAFLMLFWSNKPSALMTAELVEACINKFLEVMQSKHFEIATWAESTCAVFSLLVTEYCSSKMDKKDIKEVQEQFTKASAKVSAMAKTMFKEGESTGSFRDPEKLKAKLMLEAVAPTVVNHFNWKWKTLSATAKKKLLTCDNAELLVAVKRSYEQNQKGSSLPKCTESEQCPCRDMSKFQEYFIKVLSSKDNPVSYFKCEEFASSIMLIEDPSVSPGELPGDMVSFKDNYVYSKIMDCQTWPCECARLLLLSKITCAEIFTMLKSHMILGYDELSKRENQRLQVHSCAHCGMVESQPGTYKTCSACKSVYYCSRTCQKKDWKTGHKNKCTGKAEGATAENDPMSCLDD